MTQKKKRIFFRVDGDYGETSGLGHIYRTLKIYFYLKKNFNNKFKFIFITKNYKLGKKLIKKKTKEKIYIFNNKFLKEKIFKKKDKVIIDTLGAEKKFLKKLKNENVRSIVSFDELNSSFYRKGIIINGIYFAKKKLHNKNKNIKIYQGIKYILLDENYKIKKDVGLKNKILVCSGGADKKNFLYKIINILKNINIPKIKIIVLIGKGVKKNNKIFKFKKNLKLIFIKNKEGIKKFLDQCNIAITSGGTVMFESISAGRITFVIKTYEHQKFAIKYFKNIKLINEFGNVNQIKKTNLEHKIKLFLYNKKIIKKTYLKNRSAIDGKGFDRIKKILNSYISN